MKSIYEFGVRLPLGKLLNPVQELEQSINNSMASAGFEDKLCITSLQTGTVEVEREMSDSEIEIMKKTLHDQFEQSLGYAKVEYFRRKSGNVSQSVA